MHGAFEAQILDEPDRWLAEHGRNPPLQCSLARTNGACGSREIKGLGEPRSDPALELLDHFVVVRDLRRNHERRLRRSIAEQQVAGNLCSEIGAASADHREREIDMCQCGTRGQHAITDHDHLRLLELHGGKRMAKRRAEPPCRRGTLAIEYARLDGQGGRASCLPARPADGRHPRREVAGVASTATVTSIAASARLPTVLVRFDTGETLDEATAQDLYRRIYKWSATERWWCGAPHVNIEHARKCRLQGTLEATFDDEPIDLAMGHRDALQLFAFLATTGVDWQVAVEGPRSSATVPDPDAVFAANPTRYGDQVGGNTSRGLGAKAHYERWLTETIALVDEKLPDLPSRGTGQLRAGAWRWTCALPVTPVHLADRASLALGLRAIGTRWIARDLATITEQLRHVLATQQAYGSSAMPFDIARPFADAWLAARGPDTTWLVNGNTTESWQPLGEATFETAVVAASAEQIALIYVADED